MMPEEARRRSRSRTSRIEDRIGHWVLVIGLRRHENHRECRGEEKGPPLESRVKRAT